MNWTLKNGLLFVGATRVVLRHVVSYKTAEQTIVINTGNRSESLHVQTPDLIAIIDAMDRHFQKMGELDANPLLCAAAPDEATRKTLGTLITWLQRELGDDSVRTLLEMLNTK